MKHKHNKAEELVKLLGKQFKDICNCKLINDYKCSLKNVIQCEDEYIYKCCNKILTPLEVNSYKNRTIYKFEKKVNKNYDIDYLVKNISFLKTQNITDEKAYEIKEYFKNNKQCFETGDDIYNIMKDNNPFKKIEVDYIHIFEMWTILNNIERFTID